MGIDVNLFVHTSKLLEQDDIKLLSYRLCEAIGRDQFLHEPQQGKYALTKVENEDWKLEEYSLPTTDIGTVLEVHQIWRYYSPNYARGYWPVISATIEWFELNDFAVYYGPDSGTPELVTAQLKQDNWTHFARHGNLTYQLGFNGNGERHTCKFCLGPLILYSYNASGPGSIGYSCPACGIQAYTKPNEPLVYIEGNS